MNIIKVKLYNFLARANIAREVVLDRVNVAKNVNASVAATGQNETGIATEIAIANENRVHEIDESAIVAIEMSAKRSVREGVTGIGTGIVIGIGGEKGPLLLSHFLGLVYHLAKSVLWECKYTKFNDQPFAIDVTLIL